MTLSEYMESKRYEDNGVWSGNMDKAYEEVGDALTDIIRHDDGLPENLQSMGVRLYVETLEFFPVPHDGSRMDGRLVMDDKAVGWLMEYMKDIIAWDKLTEATFSGRAFYIERTVTPSLDRKTPPTIVEHIIYTDNENQQGQAI